PPIDLVLTDVVMPGLSGPDMLARIRDRRPVRGLLMTGYTEKLTTTGNGSGDVLEKPFESTELLRLVRLALEATPSGSDAKPEVPPPPA
ncbi:MAG: response regulator, partial [Gemmatimonadota bacterium]